MQEEQDTDQDTDTAEDGDINTKEEDIQNTGEEDIPEKQYSKKQH